MLPTQRQDSCRTPTSCRLSVATVRVLLRSRVRRRPNSVAVGTILVVLVSDVAQTQLPLVLS
jgi:hypothetical protein